MIWLSLFNIVWTFVWIVSYGFPRGLGWITWCGSTHEKGLLSVPTKLLNWKPSTNQRRFESFPYSFFIDNDANVAALVSAGWGWVKPTRRCLYDTCNRCWRYVAEGKLLHLVLLGKRWWAFTYRCWLDQPIACTCGKKAVLRQLLLQQGRQPTCRYADECRRRCALWNAWSTTVKKATAKLSWPAAGRLIVYRNFSRYLGIACANIGSILNPSTIVNGGGVSAAEEFPSPRRAKGLWWNTFPQVRIINQTGSTLEMVAGVIWAASLVLPKRRTKTNKTRCA